MKARKRSYICILFALIMFFSGMCFDTVKADSDFLAPADGASQNTRQEWFSDSNAYISENAVCTQEMIGVKNASIVGQFIKNSVKENGAVKVNFVVFTFVNTLQLQSNQSKVVHDEDFNVSGYECTLLKFIHNKDGKKRI